jgi:hypothetical protein
MIWQGSAAGSNTDWTLNWTLIVLTASNNYQNGKCIAINKA